MVLTKSVVRVRVSGHFITHLKQIFP